jgi:hypothetical protein
MLVKSKILIDEGGNARITDIGLIAVVGDHVSGTSSKDSKDKPDLLSVRWTAPELFNEKVKRNRTTDIYAFGMTMLEVRFMNSVLLAGSFPNANRWGLDIH